MLSKHEKHGYVIKLCLNKCIKILRECLELVFIAKEYLDISNTKKDNFLVEEQIIKIKDDQKETNTYEKEMIEISRILHIIISRLIKEESNCSLDKKIVNQSLKLWNLLIVSSNSCSEELFDKLISELELKEFIMSGILTNKKKEVQMIFYKNLKKLVLLLINSSQYQFIYVILDILFQKAYELANFSDSTDTSLYFKLFKFAVTTALENPETNNTFNFIKHAINICEILINPNKFHLDITMFIGYLKVMSSIIINNAHLKYKIGYEMNLLSVLTEQYLLKDIKLIKMNTLYNGDSDPLFEDIEQKTLLIREKLYDSKKSIKTIYSTINNLLSGEPKNITKIFSGILQDLPHETKLINKINYDPLSERKTEFDFVGLKNLGCTCYMNSMLQQFFNIPSFRYCLLQIIDNQPKKITDETINYDDNVLHQLRHMFTFLEFSNRKFYVPKGFCFAFKDLDVNFHLN